MLKKKVLLPIIGISLAGAISAAAVSTYALFTIHDEVNQPIYTHSGHRKTSIFLDCSSAEWDFYGTEPLYVITWNSTVATYNWSHRICTLPSKTINITTTGSLAGNRKIFLYEIDTEKYDRAIFTRWNFSGTDEEDVLDDNWFNDNKLWGRAGDFNLSSYNYCYVSSYQKDSIYANFTSYTISTTSVIS